MAAAGPPPPPPPPPPKTAVSPTLTSPRTPNLQSSYPSQTSPSAAAAPPPPPPPPRPPRPDPLLQHQQQHRGQQQQMYDVQAQQIVPFSPRLQQQQQNQQQQEQERGGDQPPLPPPRPPRVLEAGIARGQGVDLPVKTSSVMGTMGRSYGDGRERVLGHGQVGEDSGAYTRDGRASGEQQQRERQEQAAPQAHEAVLPAQASRSTQEQTQTHDPSQPGSQTQQQEDHEAVSLVPDFVKSMSKTDLQHLLSHPTLLTALLHNPATSPNHLASTNDALLYRLAQISSLAATVSAQHTALQAKRSYVTTQLLRVRALEQTWRKKEKEMESALEAFGPREMRARLGASIVEQEGICRAVEEGWIEDGAGKVSGEKEVSEWVKRVREGRRVLVLREERRARWDEGRVGGWR